ncbi:MAG: DUF4234 domain-containing protein [Actinomycetota bacterium]|nr:DUF4234 domain-containing protein [Actinomycetota bacterium]
MNEQSEQGLVQNLYYFVQQRINSDWTTDPAMAIVLSLVTFGIYGWFIFYKLMDRRDQHFVRIANVVNTAVALLKEKANQSGKTQEIAQELPQIEMLQREIYEQSRERGAALWLIIGIITGGIGVLIGYYFIMDDFQKHDVCESQFFSLMSSALAKLGRSTEASSAVPNIPERNFAIYVLLSFLTCGIFGLYWMYVLIEDGNTHFEAQVAWEDYLYKALAS